MEEKMYTLNIRQTDQYQYEVTIPETGATKTAPTLDSALHIILHDSIKHLMTRYLILELADQHVDKDDWSVAPQECSPTDLEHQAALAVAQLGIAPQVKRRECHPLTREPATYPSSHVGKLFDRYSIKVELEVELDALREEAHNNRKAAAHD